MKLTRGPKLLSTKIRVDDRRYEEEAIMVVGHLVRQAEDGARVTLLRR